MRVSKTKSLFVVMQYPRRRRDASKKRDEKGVVDFGLSLLGGKRGTFAFARAFVRFIYTKRN